MTIRSVRAFLLSYPYPEPLRFPFHGGERTIIKRDALLIRVEADNGLVGYAPGPATEAAKRDIERIIAPFLKGHRLADPDALRVKFQEGPGHDWPLMKHYCAVEIALFDLAGKERGLPVSELMGGRVRDRIRLYGSAGTHMLPEQYAEEAHAISEYGFRAYKMRAGIGPRDDVATVRLMRKAVGPDFDLMVDGQTWWRMGDRNYVQHTIEDIAEQLGEYNVAWLEEPLPPDQHDSYRKLRELEYVPIAGGAHEPTEHAYMDLIFSESVDYVQMDVGCQGGYTTARHLLPEVAHAGMRFAFHSEGTALEAIAAAQLGICWPEMVVEWLEYPCYSLLSRDGMYPFPLAAEILTEPLNLDRGDLIVPRKPGLGVDVNERVIDRFPWIPGPGMTDRLDAPGRGSAA
jgi:L-alanine-DL-glutamate epimerase-like enolase superfamily enzyme